MCKFREYGKLSHKNIDDLRSGGRSLLVTGEDQKEDPLDFVLWKPKKEGEPYWNCPWCKGRPGWHIECSVMSKRYLGDSIDIHAGGEDLIFPHHENEIAQSEAANGVPFAKYWMHNAFLNIDNRKMSKSLGNFFTVRDILEHYDGQVLRYFMLTVHYRSPLNFSRELMEAAKTSYERIVNCAENLRFLLEKASGTMTEEEKAIAGQADAYRVRFEEAMDDDFNTALAISHMFALAKEINVYKAQADSGNVAPDGKLVDMMSKVFAEFCSIIGVLEGEAEAAGNDGDGGLTEQLMQLVLELRQDARKAKNYAQADAIRNKLGELGIVIEDTPQGARWKKQ